MNKYGGNPDAAENAVDRKQVHLANGSETIHAGIIIAALAVIVWIARFWYCGGFGLYEDDYGRVIPAMESSLEGFLHHIWTVIREFGGQGRPLHHDLIYVFSYLGNKLSGLQGIYWTAYVIVATNAILFYTVLRRLSAWPVFAVTGALAFALFPADTNQAYLTTAFGSQPSLTFFLLATLCYLSGWRVASYFVILGSLLCYETVFPVFLAVPMLAMEWNSKLVKTLIRHAAVLGAMIIAVTIVRKYTGEDFVSSLDLQTVLTKPFSQMMVGSKVSISMFLIRPWETLRAFDKDLLPFLLPCFAGITWLLIKVRLIVTGSKLLFSGQIGSWFRQPVVSEFIRHIGKLAFTGLLMLLLAYPLTFTVRADVTVGRATRVHLAAVIGASILFACFCSVVLYLAASYKQKWLAAVVLAALFAGMMGYGLTVQRDYLLSWQYQRAFWTDMINLCPDLEDGSIILVEQKGLRETRHIFSWGWTMPYTIRQFYDFPSDWEAPPLAYGLYWNWRERIVKSGDLFSGVDTKGWILEDIKNPEFVLVEPGEEGLVRRAGSLMIEDQRFELKESVEPGLPPFPTRLLYRYMIKSPGEAPLDYTE